MNTLLRFVCILVIKIFFREIGVRLLSPDVTFSKDKPTLVVANHPNGLIDPIVLRIALGHDIGFLGKSTLFENWFGRTAMESFSAIPVYRSKDGSDTSKNHEMFSAVYDALEREEWIALFPEGTSHDDSKLQPLKTGAARMYLGGLDRVGDVQLLPLGLDYENKETFRSRVSVTIGAPIEFTPDEGDFEDVRELTAKIAHSLSEITLEAESPAIRDGLLWVSKWRLGEGATVEKIQAHAQDLSVAFEAFIAHDRAAADALVDDIRAFVRSLDNVGLNAWEIDERLEIRAFVPYVFGFVPALIGAILSYPTYWIIKPVAEKIAKGERDLVSTIKALAGLTFFPTTWALESYVAWQIHPTFGLVVLFLAAPISFFSIRYFEKLNWRRSAIRAYGFRRRDPEMAEMILAERAALAERIEETLSLYMPE